MDLKVTRYDVDPHGVATLRLHRPGRGNSWTGRMHDEYRWICQQAEDDPKVRVIVVTGSGTTFCAGADFKALSSYVGSTTTTRPWRRMRRNPATGSARNSMPTSCGSSACGPR